MNRVARFSFPLAVLACGSLAIHACRPVPVVEKLVGSHELTGRVVDSRGRGLAGVLVRAQNYGRKPYIGDSQSIDVAPPLDFESSLSKATERHAQLLAGTYEAITDAEGEYRIAGIVDGKFNLRAYKREYWIPVPRGGSFCVAGDVVNLIARPVVSVRMQVLMPGGEEAESAAIVFGDNSLHRMRLGPFAWSSKKPFVRVPVGELKMTAVLGAFGTSSWTDHEKADFSSDSLVVHVPDSGRAEPVVFRLKGQLGIRGTVSVGKNQDVSWGTRVYLLPLAADQQVDSDALKYSGTELSAGPTSEYVFENLDRGRYAVGLSRTAEGDVETHHVVEVTKGFAVQNLVLPEPKPERCVTVRVERTDGEVLDDVRLFFHHTLERGTRGTREVDVLRVENGLPCFQIPTGSRKDYYGVTGDEHEFRLFAQHDGFGAVEALLQAGQCEVTLRFGEPARLTVELPGFGQSTRQNRYALRLEPVEGRTEPIWHKRIVQLDSLPSSGRVELPGVVPGQFKLTVLLRDEGVTSWSGRHVAVEELKLEAGSNQAAIPIPDLCELKVDVEHGAGATLTLKCLLPGEKPDGRMYERAKETCDAQGMARFHELAAGHYKLFARVQTQATDLEVELQEFELRDPANELRATLPELCSFDVHVERGAGRTVYLEPSGPTPTGIRVRRHQSKNTCLADGSTHFQDVPAGTYELVTSGERGTHGLEVCTPAFEVHSGLDVVNMEVPETHDFEIHLEDGAGGAGIHSHTMIGLRPVRTDLLIFGYRTHSSFDAEGVARFEGVPAGRYRLTRGNGLSPDRGKIEITVPSADVTVKWSDL